MGRGSSAADPSERARKTLLTALGVIRSAEAIGVRPPASRQLGRSPERIYLVGFMGSGKSTVGAALARRLNWRFVDLDRAIEERAGLRVQQIFASFGEGHFRKLEFESLREVARTPERAIVALGGGAYVSEVNRRVVAQSGMAVWLDVPFRLLVARIASEGRKRPLAKAPDQLYALHRSRLPFYHEADVRIRAGSASPDVVARAIVRIVREDWSVVVERRRLLL